VSSEIFQTSQLLQLGEVAKMTRYWAMGKRAKVDPSGTKDDMETMTLFQIYMTSQMNGALEYVKSAPNHSIKRYKY
jgi:hypothetical protein